MKRNIDSSLESSDSQNIRYNSNEQEVAKFLDQLRIWHEQTSEHEQNPFVKKRHVDTKILEKTGVSLKVLIDKGYIKIGSKIVFSTTKTSFEGILDDRGYILYNDREFSHPSQFANQMFLQSNGETKARMNGWTRLSCNGKKLQQIRAKFLSEQSYLELEEDFSSSRRRL